MSKIKQNTTDLRAILEEVNALPDRGGETPPTYDGEYIVTPSTETDITLETEKKMLHADVTVIKIPYVEVKNTKGGQTATIGG